MSHCTKVDTTRDGAEGAGHAFRNNPYSTADQCALCGGAINDHAPPKPAPDFDNIALLNGWYRTVKGWHHPNAEQYYGWVGYPVTYPTAKELCDAEGLSPAPVPSPDGDQEPKS